MNIKSRLIFYLFVINSLICFGQEHETVLTAPDNWKSEIIPFPMGFAPSIDFTGFEDIRFSPGWNNAKSDEFWTYMFVWYIDTYGPMTAPKLITTFENYYNGLMGTDPHNQEDSTNALDKAQIEIIKTDEGFKGYMRVYDRFFTKDYLTLNIKITEQFCPKNDKQVIFCKISPKDFNDRVWDAFNKVKSKVNCD